MVKKIEEKFETIKVANNRKNAENCEKLFNELGNELSDLLKTGSFKDFDSFKVILDGKIA